MKLALLSLMFIGGVMGRRMPPDTPPQDMRRMSAYGLGYPYGWGFDMGIAQDLEQQKNHKAIKEVKLSQDKRKDKKPEAKQKKKEKGKLSRLWNTGHDLEDIIMSNIA